MLGTARLCRVYKNLYTDDSNRCRTSRLSGSAARGVTFECSLRSHGGWLVSNCGASSTDWIRTTGSRCRRSDRESVSPDSRGRGTPRVLPGDASGGDLRPSRVREEDAEDERAG